MYRGEIWWANLSDPIGSEPGYRRPVLIIQDDTFNQSRINTVIVAIITSNTQLALEAHCRRYVDNPLD
jgi:mRNA interferase MazF